LAYWQTLLAISTRSSVGNGPQRTGLEIWRKDHDLKCAVCSSTVTGFYVQNLYLAVLSEGLQFQCLAKWQFLSLFYANSVIKVQASLLQQRKKP